jgi:hypothetical protein
MNLSMVGAVTTDSKTAPAANIAYRTSTNRSRSATTVGLHCTLARVEAMISVFLFSSVIRCYGPAVSHSCRSVKRTHTPTDATPPVFPAGAMRFRLIGCLASQTKKETE